MLHKPYFLVFDALVIYIDLLIMVYKQNLIVNDIAS